MAIDIKTGLSGILDYRQDKELIRRQYGLRKNDNVQVYKLPKSKIGKLCSFSYTVPSMRAKRLQQAIYVAQGKIIKTQHELDLTPEERSSKLRALHAKLEYLNRQLSCEIESLPRNVVIVEEQ